MRLHNGKQKPQATLIFLSFNNSKKRGWTFTSGQDRNTGVRFNPSSAMTI